MISLVELASTAAVGLALGTTITITVWAGQLARTRGAMLLALVVLGACGVGLAFALVQHRGAVRLLADALADPSLASMEAVNDTAGALEDSAAAARRALTLALTLSAAPTLGLVALGFGGLRPCAPWLVAAACALAAAAGMQRDGVWRSAGDDPRDSLAGAALRNALGQAQRAGPGAEPACRELARLIPTGASTPTAATPPDAHADADVEPPALGEVARGCVEPALAALEADASLERRHVIELSGVPRRPQAVPGPQPLRAPWDVPSELPETEVQRELQQLWGSPLLRDAEQRRRVAALFARIGEPVPGGR